MLVKQEIINRVKDYFELNEYEAKVWLALLSKGSASAGQTAELSGVPRSRTYDVLETLEKRGFAIEKLGKPVKYIGVKPGTVIERLKKEAHKETEEKIQNLSKIKNTEEYEKLEELYNRGVQPIKKENLSAALKGKSNISNQLKAALENAKKEVIVCASALELKAKGKLFRETFERLKKSNVKIRMALFGEEEVIKELENKFDIKVSRINIKAKFFIIDRTEILFYVAKSNEEEKAIWLNSEFFSNAFGELFDHAIKTKDK